MKTQSLFYIVVFASSIICLFIPLWFAPFIISFLVSYFMEIGFKKSMLIHFAVYSLVSALYCLYAYSTGSKELIRMIGEIFKGMSFVVMLILSSVLFGITALMGAWIGGRLRFKN